MKAIYKELLDNSISGALSAIEIYNKPDFKYNQNKRRINNGYRNHISNRRVIRWRF
jgi:hypothetical protein